MSLAAQGDAYDSWSGAVLLVVLAAVAAWAWWRAWRAGRWPWHRTHPAQHPQDRLELVSSLALDAATRVHCIHWRGQALLVATQASAAPVVLARAEAAAPAERP